MHLEALQRSRALHIVLSEINVFCPTSSIYTENNAAVVIVEFCSFDWFVTFGQYAIENAFSMTGFWGCMLPMGRLRNFSFSSTWIVLLISCQSEARRGQLNSNLLPTYPAGNLAKMENEAGIDTKKSLHRWGISVCADICCKIKIILIALKNGEVKLRSQWWEKEGRQVPPLTNNLILCSCCTSPHHHHQPFRPFFYLLPPHFGKIQTLTKRILSSAKTRIYIIDLGNQGQQAPPGRPVGPQCVKCSLKINYYNKKINM